MERREAFVAALAFAGGREAGLLTIAPGPTVDDTRWCRWTTSPRLSCDDSDDLERLSVATIRVGYAMGTADGWTGRDRDPIGREWIERTLPKIVGPAGITVTAVIPLGFVTEAEILGDRAALWERCVAAHTGAASMRAQALLQLEAALNEMGGVAVHDFYHYADDDDEAAGDAGLVGASPPASQWRGNVA